MPPTKRNKDDRAWSKAIRNRDDNQCVICGEKKYINAHHLIPIEIKSLRFNMNNGITLCAKHHKWGNEISPHKNPMAFMVWMEENRPKQLEKIRQFVKNGYETRYETRQMATTSPRD